MKQQGRLVHIVCVTPEFEPRTAWFQRNESNWAGNFQVDQVHTWENCTVSRHYLHHLFWSDCVSLCEKEILDVGGEKTEVNRVS